jgi:hypothetical protein
MGKVRLLPGFIKVHRQITEHWIWLRKPFSPGQAWLDIILMANHETKKFPFGNEVVEVERGEWLTSETKLAVRWGWSRHKVRDFLDLLESDSMLVKNSDTKRTRLKVLNYDVWQDSSTTEGQQKDSKRTAKGQGRDTNKNVKNEKNNKYISCQHLSMSEEQYDKLVSEYGKQGVDDKIKYAENYAKLKNYKSLYLTLNNWLSADRTKQTVTPQNKIHDDPLYKKFSGQR